MGTNLMTLTTLVGDVAHALSEVAPSPVAVTHADGIVTVVTPQFSESFYIAENILYNISDGLPPTEAIRGSVQSAIDAFEDVVTRVLTVPWPDAVGSGEASILDGQLHLTFGSEYARSIAIPASLLAEEDTRR